MNTISAIVQDYRFLKHFLLNRCLGVFVFKLFDFMGLYRWADNKNESLNPWDVTYFWYFPIPKFIHCYLSRKFSDSGKEVGIYSIRPDALIGIEFIAEDSKPAYWRMNKKIVSIYEN